MKYLKQDLRHIVVNFPLILPYFYFKMKFPNYDSNYTLLIFMIGIALMLPLDDWIDGKRGFPYWLLPVFALMFYLYPILTILAILGYLLVNLRDLTGRDNVIFERLEPLGNVPLYVLPFIYPIHWWSALLVGIPTVVGIDCFHKIGHRETNRVKSTWIHGLLIMTIVPALVFQPRLDWILAGVYSWISILGFKILENKPRIYSWAYYQTWQNITDLIAFYLLVFGNPRWIAI